MIRRCNRGRLAYHWAVYSGGMFLTLALLSMAAHLVRGDGTMAGLVSVWKAAALPCLVIGFVFASFTSLAMPLSERMPPRTQAVVAFLVMLGYALYQITRPDGGFR